MGSTRKFGKWGWVALVLSAVLAGSILAGCGIFTREMTGNKGSTVVPQDIVEVEENNVSSTPGEATIPAGGSVQVWYDVDPKDDADPEGGCNCNNQNTCYLTVSPPPGVTASPSTAVTVRGCAKVGPITFSSATPGTYYIPATMTGGKTGCTFNTTNATFKLIVVAATIPVVTISDISPDPTNNGTTITWSANESGTYSVRVGGTDCSTGTVVASGSYTTPNSVSTFIAASYLAEGTNTIRVCVTNAQGGTGYAADTVVKDTVPPTLTKDLSGTLGQNGWYVSNVTVTLTADDGNGSGVAKIEYSYDGTNWIEYEGPFTIDTEGTTTLYHRAYDKAGNVYELPKQYIKIDKTPPTLTKTLSGTGNPPYFRSDVTVTLTGADSVSGLDKIEYNLDGAGWTEYEGPFTITGEGKHTLQHRAYDKAGNEYVLPEQEIWIDKTPPTLEKDLSGTEGKNGWYVSNVTVTLTADDGDGSGVDKIEYSYDGTNWIEYKGPFTISTEGTTTLYHRAFDKAGNEYELPKQEIKIDKTPPTLTKTLSGTYRDGYWRSAVMVTLEGSDATSGLDYIEYNLDGAGWVTYNGPFVISTPGVHTLCHRAYDKAGNKYVLPCQEIIIAAGCSHGYWKNNTTKWPSPYAPTRLVKDVFSSSQFASGQPLAPLAGQTLLNALKYTGTSTVKPLDAARILMVQAIAAVLNQAKYGVAFPYSGDVIAAVNEALTKQPGETDAQWRARMLALKTVLDIANNSMCAP